VVPEPLLGIFPDPAFHLVIEDLGGGLNIEIAFFVTRQFDLWLDLEPVAVVRQADAAGGINLGVELPDELAEKRIGPYRLPKKVVFSPLRNF
jgi:hypothetical protein